LFFRTLRCPTLEQLDILGSKGVTAVGVNKLLQGCPGLYVDFDSFLSFLNLTYVHAYPYLLITEIVVVPCVFSMLKFCCIGLHLIFTEIVVE
jgi:hypothetical protein